MSKVSTKTEQLKKAASTEDLINQAKYRKVRSKLDATNQLLKEVRAEIAKGIKRRNGLKYRNRLLKDDLTVRKQKLLERKARPVKLIKHPRPVSIPEPQVKFRKMPDYYHPTLAILPSIDKSISIRNNRRSRRNLSQVRRFQPMPKGPDGQYIMPVSVGILTIMNLGVVDHTNEWFHNDRYIWPIGYCIKRYYMSTIDPDAQAVYTASIELEPASFRPQFKIVCEDNGRVIVGPSPTGVWTEVIRLANRIRNKDYNNSASGPDYFGFSNPTIAKMIQDLPNARLCKKYAFQDFEPMNPRHIPTRNWNPPPF